MSIAAAVALSAVLATTASAHTVSTKQARAAARQQARALAAQFREEGTKVTAYGVDSCRRKDDHLFACEAYFELEDSMCVIQLAVGTCRHHERRPVAAYVDSYCY